MRHFILMLVVFAVILGGGVLAYNLLSRQVQPDAVLPAPAVQAAPDAQSPAPEEEESSQEELLPAPDFTAWDAQGNEVRLSDQFGVPIVLNFWASWCPPCKMEMPDFDKVAAEYDQDTLRFLMVDLVGANGETREDGENYIAEGGFSFPVWYDQEQQALQGYGLRAFPTTVLLDSSGNVVAAWEGAVSEDTLRQRLAAYLGL